MAAGGVYRPPGESGGAGKVWEVGDEAKEWEEGGAWHERQRSAGSSVLGATPTGGMSPAWRPSTPSGLREEVAVLREPDRVRGGGRENVGRWGEGEGFEMGERERERGRLG